MIFVYVSIYVHKLLSKKQVLQISIRYFPCCCLNLSNLFSCRLIVAGALRQALPSKWISRWSMLMHGRVEVIWLRAVFWRWCTAGAWWGRGPMAAEHQLGPVELDRWIPQVTIQCLVGAKSWWFTGLHSLVSCWLFNDLSIYMLFQQRIQYVPMTLSQAFLALFVCSSGPSLHCTRYLCLQGQCGAAQLVVGFQHPQPNHDVTRGICHVYGRCKVTLWLQITMWNIDVTCLHIAYIALIKEQGCPLAEGDTRFLDVQWCPGYLPCSMYANT